MAQLCHRSLLEVDHVGYTRKLRIGSGCLNDLRIQIISLNVHAHGVIYHLVGFIHGIIPAFARNDLLPVLRQEGTIHARCHVGCHHGCLNREGSASAEGIHQNAVFIPGGQHDEGCSQRLLDRCLTGQLAVSTLMKRFARSVQRHRHDIFIQGHAHRIICSGLRNHRHSIALLHTVDHGLFHDRLDIRRAKELTFDGIGLLDPETSVLRDVLLPRQCLGSLEQLLKCSRLKTSYL